MSVDNEIRNPKDSLRKVIILRNQDINGYIFLKANTLNYSFPNVKLKITKATTGYTNLRK